MSEQSEPRDLTRAEARSLLAWWIEAGVNVAIQEEARDWRIQPSRPLAIPADAPLSNGEKDTPPSPRPTSGGTLPATLEAFHAHLAESADLPLFRAGAARALPHGPGEAELMLLTGIPAPDDAAEGKPLGGPAWILATRMLRAIGLDPDHAYVAALTCFSGTGTRLTEADSAACRDTVLAQIALAAPKRLLLLGDQPAKLLLDQPMATARGRLHRIAGVPTVVTFPPRQLLANNRHKALAWADLQLIMGA